MDSADVTRNFDSLIENVHRQVDGIAALVRSELPKRDPRTVSTAWQRASAELLTATNGLLSDVDRLCAYAQDPHDFVVLVAGCFHESNALLVASKYAVADALGTGELSIADLAARVKASPIRLRQCLQMLAKRNIFCESEPGSDVYRNNRLSSVLLSQHEKNLNGLIKHWAEDSYNAGTMVVQGCAAEEAKCPFELYKGMKTFEWHATPEGAEARRGLAQAMVGAEPVIHGGLVYEFDWTPYRHVVDVGGGVGGAAMELLRRFPEMRVTVQDRPNVVEEADAVWQQKAAMQRDRVRFLAHDFFQPQPPKELSETYFLRMVLHDWDDADALRILRPLREALEATRGEGGDETPGRLFIAETVLGEQSPRFPYQVSMQMMTLVGAFERTEEQFGRLLAQSGFELRKIHRNRGILSLIEAVPV